MGKPVETLQYIGSHSCLRCVRQSLAENLGQLIRVFGITEVKYKAQVVIAFRSDIISRGLICFQEKKVIWLWFVNYISLKTSFTIPCCDFNLVEVTLIYRHLPFYSRIVQALKRKNLKQCNS